MVVMRRVPVMSRREAADLMGIDPTAPPETVRHAWRMWARIAHPDVGGDPEHFARLEHARRVLASPLPQEDHAPPPPPRESLRSVLRRPPRLPGLLVGGMVTLLLALLPGLAPSAAGVAVLAVVIAPAALAAGLTSWWAGREILQPRADRGHRIVVIVLVWVPLAVLVVAVAGLVGQSLLPVLPVLALPVVAAVASLDPGAGLLR